MNNFTEVSTRFCARDIKRRLSQFLLSQLNVNRTETLVAQGGQGLEVVRGRLLGLGFCLVLGLAHIAGLINISEAHAQAQTQATSQETTVDIQLFYPTAGAKGFFTTESGEINKHLSISGGLYLNYARKPLSVTLLKEGGGQQGVGAVVKNRLDADLVSAIGLYGVAELGIVLPLIMQNGLEGEKFDAVGVDVGASSLNGFVLGDLRLIPKYQLLALTDERFSISVAAPITIPTGDGDFASEKWLTFSPTIALSGKKGFYRSSLNVGYRWRKRTELLTLAIDDEVFYRFGAAVDLTLGRSRSPLEVIAEVHGFIPMQRGTANSEMAGELLGLLNKARMPMEFDLGIRWSWQKMIALTGGVGGGVLPGYGAPAARVFMGVVYMPGEAPPPDTDEDGIIDPLDQCVNRAEDLDGFEDEDGCPEIDNDKDRIVDEDDQCPNEPEDWDRFEDDDGCPDPDNDGDGVLDTEDKCPNQPEDLDGFKDEDGCAELDNDQDGLLDDLDQCPNEPEDPDGFADDDGCPDRDNDGDGLDDLGDLCPNRAEDMDGVEDDDGCPEDNDRDGIPDHLDKCPNQPETYNGIQDADGCPEKKLKKMSLVKVTEDKIEIKEKIFFKSGKAKILSKSYKLLDQVAAVLKGYKRIKILRIEGHTDSRGRRKTNMRLSQQRANSVRAYLVNKGVDPSRLQAKGFGPNRPVASNRSKRGRDQNRRVEFMIAELAPLGVDVQELDRQRQEDEAAQEMQQGMEFNIGGDEEEPIDTGVDADSDEESMFEVGGDEPAASEGFDMSGEGADDGEVLFEVE